MTIHFSKSSIRRVAHDIVDLSDEKRKAILKSFPSDIKCSVVEEMVSIRLERLRDTDGKIRPFKESAR